MTATQLLVVPKSMPMTLAMIPCLFAPQIVLIVPPVTAREPA
jgi:hypothetical protein